MRLTDFCRYNQCPIKEKPSIVILLIAKSPGLDPSSNTLATDAKSRLIRKDPDAGKDWGQEEKRAAEDEKVGWHHRLSGHAIVVVQSPSRVQLFVTPWARSSMPGFPVLHHLQEFAQTHVHWVGDAAQPSNEFEQTPGDGEGQGSLLCSSPWGHKESDMA